MNLSVLYRGPLTSCNYSCGYCPFAKRKETDAQLERDRQGLLQFISWIERQHQHVWRVLFTPWGEALVRRWYRDAVTALTHIGHIESAAVQTNLSCNLDWTSDCRADRLAFWATYHPTESDVEIFVNKVQRLHAAGIRVTVGMVGVPEFLEQIAEMRRRLPQEVYLWINAQQPRPRRYRPDEMALLSSIDPQFELAARRLPSFGKVCQTGEVTFTIDGGGDMRRCHFVDDVIGNIHAPDWEQSLRARPCPNRFCDCFLGKAQLNADSLKSVFGSTLLERQPISHVAVGDVR